MTQVQRILQYLEDFGSINPMQALMDLGIMRLAARIADIRRSGIQIDRKIVTGVNRYGESVHFAEYRRAA